jgi:hypothetical protein
MRRAMEMIATVRQGSSDHRKRLHKFRTDISRPMMMMMTTTYRVVLNYSVRLYNTTVHIRVHDI